MSSNFIVNPSSVSRDEIKSDLENWLSLQPDAVRWKDFFKSSTGQILVEFMSGVTAYLQYNNITARRESFWIYANNRSSVIAGSQSQGYSSFRGRNVVLKLTVIPNVTGIINKYEPVGTVKDLDMVLLNEESFNVGVQKDIYVVLGTLKSESIITTTNQLSSFRYTNNLVSSDLRLLLNDNEVNTSERILDLLNEKFFVQTNAIGSVDVSYLNLPDFTTKYGIGDTITLEWVELKSISFSDNNIKFDYGTLSSYSMDSLYTAPESIESIKVNARLFNETQFTIRGRRDYIKIFKLFNPTIVSTEGIDISPAVVKLFYVRSDFSLFTPSEIQAFESKLATGTRPLGVEPPLVGHPKIRFLELKIDVVKKSTGDILAAVDTVMSTFDRKLGNNINFQDIEDSLEKGYAFIKIARVDVEATIWASLTDYLPKLSIIPSTSNGYYYEFDHIVYKTGLSEPVWPLSGEVSDGDIIWEVLDLLPCDALSAWLAGSEILEGDELIPSAAFILANPLFANKKFRMKGFINLSNHVQEIQKIAFSANPADEGTWRIEYDNGISIEETVDLPYNSNSVDVQNAINGLPSLSNVAVTGDFVLGFTASFGGPDANKSHNPFTFSDTGNNEIQCVEFSLIPNSGLWTINFDGQVTGSLAHNATALTVKSALEALSNIGLGNVAVTGDYSTNFNIEYKGALEKTDFPQLTIPNNTLISAVTVTPSVLSLINGQNAVVGQNEIQKVTFSLLSQSGQWSIDFDSSTTSLFQYNASSAQVKSALEALSTIGVGNVDVSGSMAAGFTIEFKGALQKTDVVQMLYPTNTLKYYQVVAPSVTTVQGGGGGNNEVQKISFDYTPDGGNWKLKFDYGGQEETTEISIGADTNGSLSGVYWTFNTPALNYYVWYNTGSSVDPSIPGRTGIPVSIVVNDTISTIKAATISAITTAASANVTATNVNAYKMKIKNIAKGVVNDALSETSGFSVNVIVQGVDAISETGFLDSTITARQLESELQLLSNIGTNNVQVSGDFTNGFILNYRGSLANINVNPIILSGVTLTKSIPIGLATTMIQEGIPVSVGVDEVQKITFNAVPDSGSFQILFGAETTSAISWNHLAIDVQNALNGLTTLSSVIVSGSYLTGFTITFQGVDGKIDHPLMVISSNTLYANTVAVTITPCTVIDGRKPAKNLIKKVKASTDYLWNGIDSITFTAAVGGPDGNLISLSFDGSSTVASKVSAWNSANPGNQVVHNGIGSEIPVAGVAQLAGGNNLSIGISTITLSDATNPEPQWFSGVPIC